MTDLSQAILRTVAYFSLWEMPITTFEIWKWLWDCSQKISLSAVSQNLTESDFLASRLINQDGFWTLAGQDIRTQLWLRHRRYLDATQKYRRLRLATRYLSLIPTIRCIAACNTLAFEQTQPESDIDIFIIVRADSLWTTRLLAVAPFKFLGLRPGRVRRDSFCFSFFLSDSDLDLSGLQLSGGDPYLFFWIRSLVPVFDRDGVWNEFYQANGWLSARLPNGFPGNLHRDRGWHGSGRSCRSPRFFEIVAEKIQRYYLPKILRDMANQDSRVVIDKTMLKFHEHDRRAEYRDRWESTISEISESLLK